VLVPSKRLFPIDKETLGGGVMTDAESEQMIKARLRNLLREESQEMLKPVDRAAVMVSDGEEQYMIENAFRSQRLD